MDSSKEKINIALIEDSEDDILLATIALDETQIVKNIFKAKNGESGLELIKNNKNEIDLLLMDLNLPLMTGLEVLKELKDLKYELPIAIFTSSDLESDMVLSHEYNADFFIRKPNTICEYIEIMKTITAYALEKKNASSLK